MYFDIRDIADLYKVTTSADTIEVGANLTFTDLQELFAKYKVKQGLGYLEDFSSHIDLIGHTAMRNVRIMLV